MAYSESDNSIANVFTKKNCANLQAFWGILSNFLDDFKRISTTEKFQRLNTEPDFIEEKLNALLAGTAEQLAINNSLEIPSWVYKKKYHLKDPFFPSGLEGDYRIFVLRESPLAFRVRNIFVSANVLDRV